MDLSEREAAGRALRARRSLAGTCPSGTEGAAAAGTSEAAGPAGFSDGLSEGAGTEEAGELAD